MYVLLDKTLAQDTRGSLARSVPNVRPYRMVNNCFSVIILEEYYATAMSLLDLLRDCVKKKKRLWCRDKGHTGDFGGFLPNDCDVNW